MSIETATTLEQAANVIRRNGWTNCGDFYEENIEQNPEECPVCTLGAIAVAAGEIPGVSWFLSPEALRAAEAVRQYLNLDPKDELSTTPWERINLAIGGWNDNDAENAENVIAALEGAARVERERAA